MARLIVFCAQQRSGTTALQWVLDGTGRVRNFGEVFHTYAHEIERESNYFWWRNHVQPMGQPMMKAASEADARAFLDHLCQLSDRPYALADIKYNSWHHFSPAWFDPMDEPVTLSALKDKEIAVIHIIRKNAFLQYFSAKQAQSSKIHHYRKGRALETVPISIDVEDCRKKMDRVRERTQAFRGYLSGYSRAYELVYEEIFDREGLTTTSRSLLREALDGEVMVGTEVPYVKPEFDLNELVLNREEVLLGFSGTPHEEWVVRAFQLE